MIDCRPNNLDPAIKRSKIHNVATVLIRFVAILFSFTWAYADCRKSRLGRSQRRAFLRRMNFTYLGVAALVTLGLFIRSRNELSVLQQRDWYSWPLLFLWFQFSRCNEIFYAFYRDAIDRLNPALERGSSLTWSERVGLALNSYLELILNFAIMYALLPTDQWHRKPSHFSDLLSYSATTITTSGGGNLAAKDWPLQLLTSYEIFCGLILLVVCFAIYAGRGVEEVARQDLQRQSDLAASATGGHA